MAEPVRRGIRAAQTGMLVNVTLVVVKLVAGIVGNTYALIADAVESTADIFSSLVVWHGLSIAAQPADEDHPYGHGKAEPLAASIVSLMLLAAAVGIAVQSIREIRTPHHSPAAWTLGVLVAVVLAKWTLSRRVAAVGADIGSTAVKADAFHHMSDALTSVAAFIGISIALMGGPGWESADDWAALLASGLIAYNGVSMLRPALNDLMDRVPDTDIVGLIRQAAFAVPGVRAVEKLVVNRAGMAYRVTIHVQSDASMRLDEAHRLGGRVKHAIKSAVPQVDYVVVHMEPYDATAAAGASRAAGRQRV